MNAKLPPSASNPAGNPAIAWPASAVLVVDDEEGMRNFLTKTLAPRCGQVLAAASAEAGVLIEPCDCAPAGAARRSVKPNAATREASDTTFSIFM